MFIPNMDNEQPLLYSNMQCLFGMVDWKGRRHIDVVNLLNNKELYPARCIVPSREPLQIGLEDKRMRYEFLQSLFTAPREAGGIWIGQSRSAETDKLCDVVLSDLTELRRKLKMGAERKSILGDLHTFANFSGL